MPIKTAVCGFQAAEHLLCGHFCGQQHALVSLILCYLLQALIVAIVVVVAVVAVAVVAFAAAS